MKWINEYFFGGQAHWSDYLWFYGTLLYGIFAFLSVWVFIH